MNTNNRPLVSHIVYADGTDRQKDGHQTVTFCFQLDTASVITPMIMVLLTWQSHCTSSSS